MSSKLSLQSRCRPKRSVQVEHVHDLGRVYGLTLVGGCATDDPVLKQVRRLVKFWEWNLGEPAVSFRALVLALAADAQDDVRDLNLSLGAYEERAEWLLVYVLNHLQGSGLSVVRMDQSR